MSTLLPRLNPPALALALAAFACALAVVPAASAKDEGGPKLAHMVFFTLKDRSAEAREKFVASCHKYLSNHEGAVYYSVGTIAEDVVEPGVSVRDFDVALHVVFEDKAAKLKYLEHERHKKFVDENKAQFAKVRVLDSYLIPDKK